MYGSEFNSEYHTALVMMTDRVSDLHGRCILSLFVACKDLRMLCTKFVSVVFVSVDETLHYNAKHMQSSSSLYPHSCVTAAGFL